MSAQGRAQPDDTDDAVDVETGLLAAPDWPWRHLACRGCGQRPKNVAPRDAVAVIRLLQRRSGKLLHHRGDALRQRRPEPGSWSAMEPAALVSAVLGIAGSQLRRLFGEATTETGSGALEVSGPAPTWPSETPSAVLAVLSENAIRLTDIIDGATAEDWSRPRPEYGVTAGELVWLALHEATHHLEDAELLLDAALAGPRETPDEGDAWPG